MGLVYIEPLIYRSANLCLINISILNRTISLVCCRLKNTSVFFLICSSSQCPLVKFFTNQEKIYTTSIFPLIASYRCFMSWRMVRQRKLLWSALRAQSVSLSSWVDKPCQIELWCRVQVILTRCERNHLCKNFTITARYYV